MLSSQIYVCEFLFLKKTSKSFLGIFFAFYKKTEIYEQHYFQNQRNF